VSFAGLTMRGDLDMSAAAFGFATGTFFWGYFIFEVPSNVILEKVGARLECAPGAGQVEVSDLTG
jgi:ACS family tartrate transporter-like MFS transporter